MNEFFAENNVCGQTVLQLVSRGNAVIAELLRLKDNIPKVFRLDTKNEQQKYADIILDFAYLKVAEVHDLKIENSDALRDLDEEFRDNHLEIITRFYLVFESVHSYVTDLNHFLEDLNSGMYIHQSLETVFADMEGRQVMCESLYLYGVMLLILDGHIEGAIRERLLVSYYRYTPQQRNTQNQIDKVCTLLRDTGVNSAKRPPNYPEDFFKRVNIMPNFIDMVVSRLRSDDVYNQLKIYPLSKHRSSALASQAAMLYVCLYFAPELLHNEAAVMREIVDKYFPDNWMVSVYMGYTVNLIESWENFKAARTALNNTLEASNVKPRATEYGASVTSLLKATSHLLKEGNLTEETVVGEIHKIIALLRDCNVVIRWLVLHVNQKPHRPDRNKKPKQLRELASSESKYVPVNLFKLLLNTAQLELTTKEIVKKLLEEKPSKWNEMKKETSTNLTELSEVFSGSKPLTRISKNANLERWFVEIAKEVDSLDQNDLNSGRKIVQLIQALEEVEEFHQLNKNMQVVQFLGETRRYLHAMIKNQQIKDDTMAMLQIISDVSYAWELIDVYTPIMQSGIKKEPTLCKKLRAVFLKLASALEVPLLRINQARSEDLISVSQYYSGELEIYIRKVLQIIPEMMFENMARIIRIQTSVLKELPTRLEKDKLKEYAQLNERFEFAELTHSVSVYSEGMRMMKSTLVGVVCLDPKQLLEDGIRKELVRHISKALHTELIFSARLKPDELEQRLKTLARIMDGYKRSFEYIQDYINVNGLKIWQEEVTRIINYNVEQECNGFLRNKVYDWESVYQNRYVPIPYYPPTDGVSENFIGRLAREIIRFTDPRTTVFVEQMSTWYDFNTHKPILNKQEFALMASAVEVTGLSGLDRLFSFMIITNLQKVIDILENKQPQGKANNVWTNTLNVIESELKAAENQFSDIPNVYKFYQNCLNRTSKLWPQLLEHILNIGQLQLFRILIAFQLNLLCRFNAKNLESSLNLLNKALLKEVTVEVEEPPDESPSEELLLELSRYFDRAGIGNPLLKIYVTTKPSKNYSFIMFIFILGHLHRLFILQGVGNVHKRTQDLLDGFPFIVGIHTVFKQFHPNFNENFIKLLSEFIMALTRQSVNAKNGEVPNESYLGVRFLEIYSTLLTSSHEAFLKYMPEEIVYVHSFLNSANA